MNATGDERNGFSNALLSVTNNSAIFTEAGDENGVDPALLASIVIQESKGQPNAIQKGGQGVGEFQIDLGQNPNVTMSQALDPEWSAGWAAAKIAHYTNLYVQHGSTL